MFFLSLTNCQSNSLSIIYNDVYIGKNISFDYGFSIDSSKKNILIIGLKLHDNRPILDNQYYLFKDRFHADNFIEHFGIDLGYNHTFKIESIKVKPYLFTKTDLSYISMKNVARNPLEPFPDSTPAYEESSFSTPPWITIESRIGVGIKVPIYKNISLQQDIGIGIAYFIPTDEANSVIIFTENYLEFISTWSIGIAYSFNK